MSNEDDRSGAGRGVMAGVRVVELAAWVAGPAAAGVLADWGADVIKVEPPRGDPQRNVFGAVGVSDQLATPPFEVDNRGKRSVVLDLQTDEGRAAMERLLATGDVFVTNTRVKALERLGLDPAAVRARHPRIVYGIVTGYGLSGPDADRPGYDVGAFWARSALGASFVPPGQLPPALASGFGDHVTGMTLAGGIAGALFDRERTGRGHLVATSLLRAGIYGGAWNVGTLMRFGRLSRPRSREMSQTPLVNSYQAGDGHGFWLLGLEAERHWPGLLAAIEREDLAADERFATARDRSRHAEALVAELDVTFASRTMPEWIERFDANDVWWAPINTPRSLLEDPQAEASGAFVDMTPRDGEEPFRAVASPIDFDDLTLRPGPVPRLGEHTAEVLGEFD
jgi:crotonobetainyl-CoA:carnitine CoA-transferase CaiB-like acyl-CoA transferase